MILGDKPLISEVVLSHKQSATYSSVVVCGNIPTYSLVIVLPHATTQDCCSSVFCNHHEKNMKPQPQCVRVTL
jgi:hypothetical protein